MLVVCIRRSSRVCGGKFPFEAAEEVPRIAFGMVISTKGDEKFTLSMFLFLPPWH